MVLGVAEAATARGPVQMDLSSLLQNPMDISNPEGGLAGESGIGSEPRGVDS